MDFLDHAAANTRYGLFSPMEVSIIFHFAGRGSGNQRLALIDFAQLLDPRWQTPLEARERAKETTSILHSAGLSLYNFVLGGFAGAFGATIVYPIDLGELLLLLIVSEYIDHSTPPFCSQGNIIFHVVSN